MRDDLELDLCEVCEEAEKTRECMDCGRGTCEDCGDYNRDGDWCCEACLEDAEGEDDC